MSNGVALNSSATEQTSDGETNRNTAVGSTKRRMSQGHAMRSIFGRERVTHAVRPWPSGAGIRAGWTRSAFASDQALKPPSRYSAGAPTYLNRAAAPWLSSTPRRQTTTTDRPTNSLAQDDAFRWSRLTLAGIKRGSARRSSSVRTSTTDGAPGVPTRRDSCATVIASGVGRRVPSKNGSTDAIFRPKPHGAIAIIPLQ